MTERPKITISKRNLARRLKSAEEKGFVRGSSIAVAAHMSAWSDDNEMLAFADMVRSNLKKKKPDAAAVKIVLDALCERYDIELQGNRELIEAAYEPTLKRGRPWEDSK